MKNKFYLKEFQYHDGESFVTFNIYDLMIFVLNFFILAS